MTKEKIENLNKRFNKQIVKWYIKTDSVTI